MIHRLIDRLMGSTTFDDLLAVANGLRDACNQQRDVIARLNNEKEEMVLEHARNTRNLLTAFLVCLESPEIDVREPILLGLRDLSDEIARLEEHHLV